jgi:hypothetical protein
MKRYFVLALALIAFAVSPVMAEVAWSGEYELSAAYDVSNKLYYPALGKLEFDAVSKLDDFNTLKFELDAENPAQVDLAYAKVITDWGKYFGFADSGFGLKSTIGNYKPITKETADFTGYNLEYGAEEFARGIGYTFDMSIMGIVSPYFGANFAKWQAAAPDQYMVGAVVDVAPVTLEAYYVGISATDAVGAVIGIEAAFSSEVADGVEVTAAGSFRMEDAGDDYDMVYGFGAGVGAYGATLNVSFMGAILGDTNDDGGSYALSQLGVDASYDVLEWLSINGGVLMNLSEDYNPETFSGAEFGIEIKPGKVTYGLGYIVANEDAANYAPLYSDSNPKAGGIYVRMDLDY